MNPPRRRGQPMDCAQQEKTVPACLKAGADHRHSGIGGETAPHQRPLYIYENKAAMSFGMSELQFSGQNEAAMSLKIKVLIKNSAKLGCPSFSIAWKTAGVFKAKSGPMEGGQRWRDELAATAQKTCRGIPNCPREKGRFMNRPYGSAAGWRRPLGSAMIASIAPEARRPELKSLRQPRQRRA